MPWAAVIGSPIEHSLSPLIHQELWRSYEKSLLGLYRKDSVFVP